MHPLIERHREALRQLCREFGITRLELVGSAATDASAPNRGLLEDIHEAIGSSAPVQY